MLCAGRDTTLGPGSPSADRLTKPPGRALRNLWLTRFRKISSFRWMPESRWINYLLDAGLRRHDGYMIW